MGLTCYFKFKFRDNYSIALRVEEFDDKDGFRTGIIQKLTGITLSPSVNLNKNLILRSDLRYDKSNVNTFEDKNNKMKESQFTTGLNIIYVF